MTWIINHEAREAVVRYGEREEEVGIKLSSVSGYSHIYTLSIGDVGKEFVSRINSHSFESALVEAERRLKIVRLIFRMVGD